MFPQMTADMFKGSPIESEYERLSPTPNEFPNFVKRVIAMDLKPYDFGADKLKATKPRFFSYTAMPTASDWTTFPKWSASRARRSLGDMRPRSESRLAILPNTTHVTVMDKADAIIPMVNEFLDAKTQRK
jgi:hypothetical protein